MKFKAAGTVAALLSCLLLTGCLNKKKAVQYVKTTPAVAAKICTELFPVKDSFIRGDDLIMVDTVILTDTVNVIKRDIITRNDTVFITETIPEIRTVVNTIYRVDTLVKRDSAGFAALRFEIGKLERENTVFYNRYQRQKRIKRKLIFYLIGAVLIILGYSFIKIRYGKFL